MFRGPRRGMTGRMMIARARSLWTLLVLALALVTGHAAALVPAARLSQALALPPAGIETAQLPAIRRPVPIRGLGRLRQWRGRWPLAE